MSHLKIVEKEKTKSWNFISNIKKSSSKKSYFLQNLKYAIFNNKFIAYAIAAGLSAAILNTLYPIGLLFIVEWIGEIAGGYALSNALKGNENIAYKSNEKITEHFIKSVVLIIAGYLVGEAVMYLPYAHIMKFFATIVLFAGVNGLFESGFEKYRRQN